MDKLIFNFTDEINPQFEKNCIRTILAKVTSTISQIDTSDLDEKDVDTIETLSTTAIALVDEVKYLEKIEQNGFESDECK
jgi:hypothetical protein